MCEGGRQRDGCPTQPSTVILRAISTCAHFMLDLSTYTGPPLNMLAKDFIRVLEAERFRVEVSDHSRNPNERRTLRIYWGDVWVGLMSATMWNAKVPCVCLYRFDRPDAPRKCRAAAPVGFSRLEFAAHNGCDPDQLYVHKDGSGSYLWVRDAETAMTLLRSRARRINEA